MTEPLYEDIEALLVAWAKTVPQVTGSGTVTPDTLTGVFVRISLVGGTDDGITDASIVDIDVFAPTRAVGMLVARQIRAALVPRLRIGSAIIDSVRTSVSPRLLPWDNANIKRFGATYAIGLRR